jgi:hypothetical protein
MPGGPQPPTSRAGLIAGITVGTVVLIAFGVTAFAWPGFLLGGDGSGENRAVAASTTPRQSTTRPSTTQPSKPTTTTPPRTQTTTDPDAAPAEAVTVAQRFVDTLNGKDAAAALSMGCPPDGIDDDYMPRVVNEIVASNPKLAIVESKMYGGVTTARLSGTAAGRDAAGGAVALYSKGPGGTWCVSTIFV